jgi:single-strand DNA-binding protein
MASVAKVTLIGNLGRDPETRYTPNGTMNVSFTVAVSRRWNDQSGQQQERTTWYRITAWSRLAETVDMLTQRGWLAKGRQVFVSGSLEASEYQDQQGQTRMSLDVRADDIFLTGNRAENEGGMGGGTGGIGGGGGNSGGGGNRGGGRSGGDSGDFGNDLDDVPF